ncbi:putative het-s domain protein [Neofusicoccum parvum UCRNP2]|uniref:Putative het-s domain protein n=1 Tax=Botryosphaeria parva (strain UCR-NP2) TaxID=1287680 RepID=R1EG53_BOTPV|nr:putative het-s domain protein [Neofusicoccum parvum UCRNP2]
MDPSITNLLACRGVLEIQNPQDSPPEFQLIFSIPSGSTTIQTLRSVLLTANPNHSLTSRIHLATSLARSVIFLHEARFVHKNIRPETILLFSSAGGERTATLGTPHLVGFEELRDDDAGTSMRGDGRRERNLYRHPQRQGLALQRRYTVRHDVYSLGVCLLEIGLWRSLVACDDDAAAAGGAGAGPTPVVRPEWAGVRPFELKRRLVEVAGAELPGRVGEVYADVVVACLTCLDADSETFGDLQGLADEDGIIVGVRYIEKILEKIEQIVV